MFSVACTPLQLKISFFPNGSFYVKLLKFFLLLGQAFQSPHAVSLGLVEPISGYYFPQKTVF